MWGGAIVGVFAVVFAVLGLNPSLDLGVVDGPDLTWIPEVPLLVIAAVASAAILLLTGFRAYRATRHTVSGLVSGAFAGVLGGIVGGVAYLAYGKSAFNVVAGPLAGAIAGGFFGAIGAVAARRRS